MQLRKERVELASLSARRLRPRPLVESRKHQFSVSLPPVPVWLEGDTTRLVQILVNLLTNAAKYTDEGGQIWLSTADLEGNEVVFQGFLKSLCGTGFRCNGSRALHSALPVADG